jgi:hypothetical protein
MRFYNVTHKHYCGIDLHARNMYTCVLDQEGKTLLHRDLPTVPDVFLKAIAPFRFMMKQKRPFSLEAFRIA